MNNKVLWLTASLVLSGCQSMGLDRLAGERPALYNGDRSVLYQVRQSAQSADQAVSLAAMAYRAGDLDQSLYLYLRALELDAKRFDALIWAGRIHRERGNLQLAELAFGDALRGDPDNLDALAEMGLLYLGSRRQAEARGYLERAQALDQKRQGNAGEVKVDSQSPLRLYNSLGVLADLGGQFSEAQRYYQLAAQIEPRSPLVQNSQGYSHYLAGDWPLAESAYRRGLDFDSGYKPLWRNYGLLLVRMQRYEEALAAFEQVGSTAEASNDVGYVCLIEGELDMAEAFFRSAIEQSPGHYELAWQNLQRVQQLRKVRLLSATGG